jgi:hypothetical protein
LPTTRPHEATLTPAAELEEAATYDVTLIGLATGANGMYVYDAPGHGASARSSAAGGQQEPARATEQALDAAVTVTFDRPMSASTITSDTFYIQKVGGAKVDSVTANENGTSRFKSKPFNTITSDADERHQERQGRHPGGCSGHPTFTTKEVSLPFSDVSTSTVTSRPSTNCRSGASSVASATAPLPSSTVTRQQYAKMLVSPWRHGDWREVCPFGDVAEREGSDPFIRPSTWRCVRHGHHPGQDGHDLAPLRQRDARQAITMVVRACDSVDRGLLDTAFILCVDPEPWLNEAHGQNARLAEYNGRSRDCRPNSTRRTHDARRDRPAALNLVQLLNE